MKNVQTRKSVVSRAVAKTVAKKEPIELLRRELLDTRRDFKEFFDLAPVSFLTLDSAGRILEANPNAVELMGFSASWLLGKSFPVFIASDNLPAYIQHMKACAAGRRSIVDVRLNIAGRIVYARILTVLLSDGSPACFRTAILDVTALRETERRLKESSADWHSLVQNAPDIILKLDKHGQIIFSNRPFHGVKAAGRTIFQLFPPVSRERLREALDDAFGGRAASCEVSGDSADGEQTVGVWYNVRFGAQATGSDTGGVETTTVIIRDVSRQKAYELQLESATALMRQLSARLENVREEERLRIARELHDELGQALTVLRMDLAWLHKQPATSEGVISERIQRMMEFTDNTIGAVRRIATELRPTILDDLGLVAAIEWLLEDFQKRSGMKCRLKSARHSVPLRPEFATTVFRVVQEALTNVARHSEATRVVVEIEDTKKKLVVKVVDNGKGIRRSAMSDRTSLGLAGMRERVIQIGGDLKIQGRPGFGTRVSFHIPLQS
jgi:PAS domain S-box-containing protein